MEIKDNKLIIDIPEGMEIDLRNSNLVKGIVKFQPKNITYNDVEIALNLPDDCTCLTTHKNNSLKLSAISNFMNIAKYYNRDWKPNWNNSKEPKYYIYYSYNSGEYKLFFATTVNWGNIYFRFRSDAQSVIDNPNFKPILDAIYKNK